MKIKLLAVTLTLTLAVVFGLVFQLAVANKNLGQAQAEAAQLEQSLKDSQESIAELTAEKELVDRLHIQAVRNREAAHRQVRSYTDAIRRLKIENEDLRQYLDSRIPAPVVVQLWQPPSGSDRDPESDPSKQSDGTDTQTTQPAREVSHEEGWEWCREVEVALDSCNNDKRLLREWAGSVD